MKNGTEVLIIRLLLAPVIGFSFIARFYAAGWLLYPIGLTIYSIIIAYHCRFHYRTVRPIEPIGRPKMLAIALSHLLFVSGFLLQYDAWDGPGWLTITLLLGYEEDPIQGTLWEEYDELMNLLVFIPVCISWYLLKRDKEDT